MEGLIAGNRDGQGIAGRGQFSRASAPGPSPSPSLSPSLGWGRTCALLAQPGDRGQAIGGGLGWDQQGPKLLQVQVPFAKGSPLALALLQIGKFARGH